MVNDKRGLFLVLKCHADLIISKEGVHECKEFMTCNRIHQLVDVGEWIAIIQADLV